MKTKAYGADLWTDLPDDSVREGDEIVQLGGRNVAAAIGELLTRLGYEVKGPEESGIYGWRLYLSQGGREFMIQVSDVPPDMILHVEDVTGIFDRWLHGKKAQLIGELVAKLKTALEADPRFHHIAGGSGTGTAGSSVRTAGRSPQPRSRRWRWRARRRPARSGGSRPSPGSRRRSRLARR